MLYSVTVLEGDTNRHEERGNRRLLIPQQALLSIKNFFGNHNSCNSETQGGLGAGFAAIAEQGLNLLAANGYLVSNGPQRN